MLGKYKGKRGRLTLSKMVDRNNFSCSHLHKHVILVGGNHKAGPFLRFVLHL